MTTKLHHLALIALLCISLTAFAAPALNPFNLNPQSQTEPQWPDIEPGIEYTHRRIGQVPWAIHIVKIDRTLDDFRFVSTLAKQTIVDLETVRKQLEALPPEWGKPLAAVNGDFFIIKVGPYQGDPQGLHIVDGQLVSTPAGLSFWITPDGQPRIGNVASHLKVLEPSGLNWTFGLNQQRAADRAVLFTPAIGPSTRTTDGVELVLEPAADGPTLPLKPGVDYPVTLAKIRQHNTPLSPGTMVLSIGPKLWPTIPPLTEGSRMVLSIKTDPDLQNVQTAIAGHPVLVTAGKCPKHNDTTRHPRTALGWNDKSFFLVVVDGRQEKLSDGMTCDELAALMLELGCTEAMNLDGGGSSTLWLGGKVVNSPSDGRERRVANGLVLLRTPKND
ncbi:MAG: phosphodiester glycosidase family protein [Sedimentisphaerales bacterium]|nr:phosphodiester glycosidase family protein [Sedimentisphaerales bacterium]